MAEPASMRSDAWPCLRSHSRTSSPGVLYGLSHWAWTEGRKSIRSGGSSRIASDAARRRSWCGVRISRSGGRVTARTRSPEISVFLEPRVEGVLHHLLERAGLGPLELALQGR